MVLANSPAVISGRFLPPMRTEPPSDGTRRHNAFRKVVFPAPLGPMMPTIWPALMAQDTSRTIRFCSMETDRFRTAISVIAERLAVDDQVKEEWAPRSARSGRPAAIPARWPSAARRYRRPISGPLRPACWAAECGWADGPPGDASGEERPVPQSRCPRRRKPRRPPTQATPPTRISRSRSMATPRLRATSSPRPHGIQHLARCAAAPRFHTAQKAMRCRDRTGCGC